MTDDIGHIEIADLHTHTIFSDGRMNPGEVWGLARERGLRLGISDHCGEGSFQINSDPEFLEYLQALEGYPIYRSAELDLGTEVRISPDLLNRCDYLIGGVHSLGSVNFFDPNATVSDPEQVKEEMLELIREKSEKFRFDILAHPGLLPLKLRDRSDILLDKEWGRHLIELALEFGFVLEISNRWRLPGPDIIRQAREAGVRFSLGSDGHCPDSVCRLDYSLEMVDRLKIDPDMIFHPGSAGR